MKDYKIPPKVAAVHDISGFGRCALTVIIPAMSALGVQVCPVPTAILSTHTGGFKDFTFRDLTSDIKPMFDHWEELDISFDATYTGFLGSYEQIGIVKNILENYEKCGLKVIDPVMADEGELYSTYTKEMQEDMRILVSKSDITTPNFTECCFLTGLKYTEGLISHDDAVKCVKELAGMGSKLPVLTGLHIKEGYFTNFAYNPETGEITTAERPKLPGSYPGTGDLFSSVLTGLILKGYPLKEALEHTTGYVSDTIELTNKFATPIRDGVLLESTLSNLTRF